MKKSIIIAIALVMVASFGTGSAFAANSLQQGNMSISVGMGDSIFGTAGVDVIDLSGRYLVAKDLAIIAGFGLRADGGDSDGTYFSIAGGARKYFKTDDFAPFIGGQLKIVSDDNGAFGKEMIIDMSGVFGAEVFLNKQFSMEGAVGLGFGTIDYKDIDQNSTFFGTRTVGVRANFYF